MENEAESEKRLLAKKCRAENLMHDLFLRKSVLFLLACNQCDSGVVSREFGAPSLVADVRCRILTLYLHAIVGDLFFQAINSRVYDPVLSEYRYEVSFVSESVKEYNKATCVTLVVMLPEKFLSRKADCREAMARYNRHYPKTEVFSLNEIRKKRRKVVNPSLLSISRDEEQRGIVILGSTTLEKYTDSILVKGFREMDWNVSETMRDVDLLAARAVLFQLHGSPASVAQDREIIRVISEYLFLHWPQEASSSSNAMAVESNEAPPRSPVSSFFMLIHRPDEIQLSANAAGLIELLKALQSLSNANLVKFSLVFLGSMHLSDSFFTHVCGDSIRVVPHGFFDLSHEVEQLRPVLMGCHTAYGEMRSLELALSLLHRVVVHPRLKECAIYGYLGGDHIFTSPTDGKEVKIAVSAEYLNANYPRFSADLEYVNFSAINFWSSDWKSKLRQIQESTGKAIVLVDSLPRSPYSAPMTFNMQMYHFGSRIRTGESSGSLHASKGIPVILEMNGADLIEDLQVIKIPYADVNDVSTVDLIAGADLIVSSIVDGTYYSMMRHNGEVASKLNARSVAQMYCKLMK